MNLVLIVLIMWDIDNFLGSSKMKFQMTIEQGQRPLKAMKHTLANDYCQARKQKLANKNKLSEKTFSDQIGLLNIATM